MVIKKVKIKFLAIAVMLLCSCFALTPRVKATDVIKPDNAEWLVDEGENHVWYKLEGTTLTIGGSGKMKDWNNLAENPDKYPHTPWYNKDITDIIIEEGVTRVGDYSFYTNGSLESLKIADSVTEIGTQAIHTCSKLQNIEFGKGLEVIGIGNFYQSQITTLSLPEGLREVGAYSFQSNNKLAKIILPSTLTKIDQNSFNMGTTNALNEVISYAPIAPTLGNNTVFKNVNLEKLTIPYDSRGSYETNWNIASVIKTDTEINEALDIIVHEWGALQGAIDRAPASTSRTIKLGSDIVAPNPTTDASIAIAEGKDITLDLNGHVLDRGLISDDGTATANASGSVIQVAGKLTIIDSNPDAEHKGALSEDGFFWNWDGGANTGDTIIKGGILTGGCRSGSYNGGSGIRVDNNNAILTMDGGTIAGNKSLNKAHAGGVYVNNGTFDMTGGEIKYNTANLHGGGVFVRYGKFNMSGTAKITKNAVSSNGGGLYIMNNNFTMNGGEISCNKGKDGGGVRTEGSMTIAGGVIKNNIATGEGGGVRGAVIMSEGEISGNTAATNGGGIRGSSTITGGKIINNTANGDGGGYYGNLTITGGEISGNTANGKGGGFYMDSSAIVGGSAIISGNYDKDELANNLYLDTDKIIDISTDSAPTSDMNIGITTAVAPVIDTPVPITSNASEDDEGYFTSDNIKYYVLNQDDILKLAKDTNPTGKITVKENSFTSFLNTITFGLFFNETFDVEITASDDVAVSTVEYYISDTQLTEDEVKVLTDWTTYSKFSIESEDKYIVYAKITDSLGNITYISSDGFVLDMTAPVINGLGYGNGFYYTTQKFTVDDSYIDKVLINGVETTDYILPGNVDETYEIDALDKAGNPTYLSIRMMPIDTIDVLIDEYTVENVAIDNKEDIEYIKDKVDSIDTTHATDEEKSELQAIADKCDEFLEAIKNKYIAEIEFTVTPPKADQVVGDNTFTVVSEYDNVIVSVKEWKINGGSETLPDDYVFKEDTIYIPILKVEVKNPTHYFDENTTLTIHGSVWGNGEGTFSLKDHRDYGYVKDLGNNSFLIDEMTVRTDLVPESEPGKEPEEEASELGAPDTGNFVAEHATAITGLVIGFPVFVVLLYVVKRTTRR